MNAEREPPVSARMEDALAELRELIGQHYPTATFRVSRGPDDPEAVHLHATVDVEDIDEVVDLVLERMMALQIEEGLPVFVIPAQPHGRVAQQPHEWRQPPATLSPVIRGGPP